MPEFSIVVLATSIAQTLSAAVIALLLFGFFRQYGKSYLAHWTASWVALTLVHLGGAAGAALAMRNAPPSDPARVATAIAVGAAGYLQVAWLLFGAYELLRRRPVRIRVARGILAAVVVLGAGSAPLFDDSGGAVARGVAAAAAVLVSG